MSRRGFAHHVASRGLVTFDPEPASIVVAAIAPFLDTAFVEGFDVRRLAEGLFVETWDVIPRTIRGAAFIERFDIREEALGGEFTEGFDVVDGDIIRAFLQPVVRARMTIEP